MNLLRFGSTPDADLAWSDLTFSDTGVAGALTTPWGRRAFHLPLFGEFNVANFAAATGAACLAGASIDDVIGRDRTTNGAAGAHAVRTIARTAVGGHRLCTHPRRADEGAVQCEAPRRRSYRLCVRMRRRSRSRQASVDGAGRRSGCRSCVRYERQPAFGRSCSDRGGDSVGFSSPRRAWRSNSIAAPRSVRRLNLPRKAMSSWSPEKVTSLIRRLPASVIRLVICEVVQQIFAAQSGTRS